MKIKKQFYKFITFFSLAGIVIGIGSIAPPRAEASGDFSLHHKVVYTLKEDHLEAVETKTISNNTSNQYIPGTEEITFTMQDFFNTRSSQEALKKQINTLEVSRNNYEVDEIESSYQITVPFDKNLYSGESQTFRIEYKDYQLASKVGSLININLPQQPKADTNYSYSKEIFLKIPNKHINSLSISPEFKGTPRKDNNYTTYRYGANTLQSSGILFQIGNSQSYSFNITQRVGKTYETKYLKDLTAQKYTITLPREYTETNQKVYIEDISPEPDKIYQDKQGNYFADFIIPTNKDTTIEIDGYISVKDNSKPIPKTKISEVPTKYILLTESQDYWDTDSPVIQDALEEIEESEVVIEIIKNSYLYTIESLEYNDDKILNNERFGAEKALRVESGVCMEYADLLIALLRAQGVPARGAFGRGFNNAWDISNQQNHQWVQAYVPEYGWLSVDPTWGENKIQYIGPDLEKVLWYTSQTGPEEVASVSYISARDTDIERPNIEFEPIESISPLDDLEPISNYINLENNNSNWTNNLETTMADAYKQVRLTTLGIIIDSYFPFIIFFLSVITLLILIKIISGIIKLFKRDKDI